jgi:hypothetical protein
MPDKGWGVLGNLFDGKKACSRFRSAAVTSSLSSFTTAPRLERGVTVAWSKTMTTTLSKVTALALLVASFAFSGALACADAEDTSSIQILTFDAVGNPGEIVAALDCDTGDGMGNCPVETLVTTDTVATTVADALFDPAVLEATAEATAGAAEPMIRSVEAIITGGNQTEVIVVTDDTDTKIEEPAQTAAIAAPSAEPADITTSAESVSQPNEEKAGQAAAAAIVLEVTQPETVAVAGEPVDDPVVTVSIGESSSTTPVSMAVGKNGD